MREYFDTEKIVVSVWEKDVIFTAYTHLSLQLAFDRFILVIQQISRYKNVPKVIIDYVVE